MRSPLLYRRGSLRGQLLLVGSLGYFLSVYGSFALATAYNDCFLLDLATFSASLFALALTVTAVDLRALPERRSARFPRRASGGFMLTIALVTLARRLARPAARRAARGRGVGAARPLR